MFEQLAWMIEWIDSPPAYWDGRGPNTFSTNPNDGIRFSRQEDADRVRYWILDLRTQKHCESRQHGWADMPERQTGQNV